MTNTKLFLYFCLLMTTIGFSQTPLQWQFNQKNHSEFYPIGEKGTVQQGLFNAGLLPEPFYGLNEEKYNWIENEEWIFESTFNLTKEQLHEKFIDINFKNVDTYATVFINGKEVGKTASFFVPYRFNIKPFVKEGKNTVQLHFVSPVQYHKSEYQALKVKFPTPNDVNDTVQVSSMSRKPQFQFGWDWSLRMNTIGLNEPTFIETYSVNKLRQSAVQTLQFNEETALMRLDLVFEQPIKDKVSVKNEFIQATDIQYEDNVAHIYFQIRNPRLYWLKGWGEQTFYKGVLSVFLDDKLINSENDFYFGISKKELIQQADEFGTSYEIHWNGKLIFCKGGDYVPQDVFLSTVDENRIKQLIDACADANFNMIRVWGGGYYLPDFFYRYCAEKGILIWQDFMFACALYPSEKAFLALVQDEMDYQIPRISKNPNVALFNGNNEVMVASNYWGFKLKYGIDGKTQDQFDVNYRTLFQELIPKAVEKWTTVPYVHTSPLSHWGKDEWYKHGSQHYWGVWHGSDPLEDFARKSGRFNAEYGFQSFSEYSTLLKFSEKSDWNLKSPVMKQHQKSYVGNAMILKQTEYLFGKPTDFEDFVYLSQLTQAEAVGLAIASHRLQFPRVTGTIYWQINDCWPVSSWSSMDYYGNWKALHYRSKADFESITVLRNLEKDNSFTYWITNDNATADTIRLTAVWKTLSGDKIASLLHHYYVHSNEKTQLKLDLNEKTKDAYLIDFEWKVAGKTFNRQFIHNEKNYKRNTEPIEIETIRPLVNGTAEVVLNVKAFSAYTWLTSTKGNIFIPENFKHFFAGKHAVIIHYQGEIPRKEDLQVKHY